MTIGFVTVDPSPAEPGADLPADVVIARAVRSHTRTLAAVAGVCLLFALVGVGALSMAGENATDAPVLAGLTQLGVGQVCALAAAAIAGIGLVTVLRGVGEPGSADSASAARRRLPSSVTRTTAARLAILMRVTVGALVLTITVWALANPAGIIGSVIGALVAVQLVVVLALLRVHLLRSTTPA